MSNGPVSQEIFPPSLQSIEVPDREDLHIETAAIPGTSAQAPRAEARLVFSHPEGGGNGSRYGLGHVVELITIIASFATLIAWLYAKPSGNDVMQMIEKAVRYHAEHPHKQLSSILKEQTVSKVDFAKVVATLDQLNKTQQRILNKVERILELKRRGMYNPPQLYRGTPQDTQPPNRRRPTP